MSYWQGRHVLVTGGTGFVGSHLVERLLSEGARVRVVGRDKTGLGRFLGSVADQIEFLEGDLAADAAFARSACSGQEAVFNLAAAVAGVGYNVEHPGELFRDNVGLGMSVLDAAVKAGVERFLCMSSACVYTRHCTIPTPESEGFLDDPEVTNLGYGWAKRALEVQARCYTREYPIRVAIVRPYNIYGPRDDFDWETSHVIPALIRKTVEGQDPLVVWGDGSQTRSFLYVEDCVDGLVRALERYPECDPVNIGTDEEVTIGNLVRTVHELCGSQARIEFDTTRPSGQPRRNGNFLLAREKLGFVARVPLREGLARTIAWYREHGR